MNDRDTFAAAALTGMMQFRLDAATPGAYVKSTAAIAANAYDIADAMLRERGQSDRSQPIKPAEDTPDTHATQADSSVQERCTLTVEEREAIETAAWACGRCDGFSGDPSKPALYTGNQIEATLRNLLERLT
jgi:hypothetical protein